jgi:hypothetical protein
LTEYTDTIIVDNAALTPRSGIACAVVSFPQGAITAGETPHGLVDEHGNAIALDLLPGRWPDGSPRRGLAQFFTRVAAASEEVRRVRLAPGAWPPGHTMAPPQWSPTFQWTPRLVAAIGGLNIEQQGGTKWTSLECIGDYALVKVFRRRGRSILHPGNWCEVTYTVLSGQPYMPFTYRWGWSEPGVKDLTAPDAYEVLHISGALPVIRAEQSKVLAHGFEDGRWSLKLHHGRIGDGQSQLVYGSLLLPGFTEPQDLETLAAERQMPLQASSTSWREHKTFGPYGYVPPVSASDAIALSEDIISRFEVGDPWQASPKGLPPWGSQTGAQEAFANQVAPELTAHPRPGLAMALNVAQEACRPIYFREPDASPVTLAKHPLALRFCGRPQVRIHWIDALGKPHDPGDYSATYKPTDYGALTAFGYGWDDADPEHKATRRYLGAYGLTRFDPGAIEMAEDGADMLMAEYPVGTGWGDVQAAPRTSRGLYDLCWLAMFVNDALAERIRVHVLRRIREVVLPAFPAHPAGPVVCSQWFEPSNQSGGLPVNHWRPWECVETARFLGAAHALWPSQDVQDALTALCDSIVEHGIIERPDGFQIATAMAWKEGAVLTGAEYADPTLFKPADGTGYLLWSLAAVQLATTPKARAVEQFILGAWGKEAEAWRVR